MSTILLSIKPIYVKQIFDGVKKFEFRRTKTSKPIDRIVIYETWPTMRVVGEVEVIDTIIEQPATLWLMSSGYAGIDKFEYNKYFYGVDFAVAYKLGRFIRYDESRTLESFGVKNPPQSFIYLK